MKVRDLLRKIVNGEDLPQKIKINDDIYVLNDLRYLDEIYAVENKRWEYYNFSLIDFYDNEVEIIEEQKENIIKEVREYIDRYEINSIGTPLTYTQLGKELLEILDKAGDSNERNKDNK